MPQSILPVQHNVKVIEVRTKEGMYNNTCKLFFKSESIGLIVSVARLWSKMVT